VTCTCSPGGQERVRIRESVIEHPPRARVACRPCTHRRPPRACAPRFAPRRRRAAAAARRRRDLPRDEVATAAPGRVNSRIRRELAGGTIEGQHRGECSGHWRRAKYRVERQLASRDDSFRALGVNIVLSSLCMETCSQSDGSGCTTIGVPLIPRLRLLTANADTPRVLSEGSVTSEKPLAENISSGCFYQLSPGVSFAGLQRIVELFLPQRVGAGVECTTDHLCQHFVRPATLPAGWMQVTDHTDLEAHAQAYVHTATGKWQRDPPAGTRSFVQMLADEPTMTQYVGEPTHLLSKAWKGDFVHLLNALRAFVVAQPDGSPECFFWCHLFSVDHHTDDFGTFPKPNPLCLRV
jgi:hypothetical protein